MDRQSDLRQLPENFEGEGKDKFLGAARNIDAYLRSKLGDKQYNILEERMRQSILRKFMKYERAHRLPEEITEENERDAQRDILFGDFKKAALVGARYIAVDALDPKLKRNRPLGLLRAPNEDLAKLHFALLKDALDDDEKMRTKKIPDAEHAAIVQHRKLLRTLREKMDQRTELLEKKHLKEKSEEDRKLLKDQADITTQLSSLERDAKKAGWDLNRSLQPNQPEKDYAEARKSFDALEKKLFTAPLPSLSNVLTELYGKGD